ILGCGRQDHSHQVLDIWVMVVDYCPLAAVISHLLQELALAIVEQKATSSLIQHRAHLSHWAIVQQKHISVTVGDLDQRNPLGVTPSDRQLEGQNTPTRETQGIDLERTGKPLQVRGDAWFRREASAVRPEDFLV